MEEFSSRSLFHLAFGFLNPKLEPFLWFFSVSKNQVGVVKYTITVKIYLQSLQAISQALLKPFSSKTQEAKS